ncbi:MoaD/ThiS family protein [Chloroflexota bacterium]
MVVSIKFLGIQRAITKIDCIDMPITENTRVNDALKYIKHRYPGLHLDEGTILITVNQKKASLGKMLRANDTVSFLPFISGG